MTEWWEWLECQLRMIQSKRWQKGNNANSDDLLAVSEPFYNDYSGPTDFTAFFDSWLKLLGLPVLNMTINYDDANTVSATVSQYRMVKKNVNDDVYNELWYIPLTIETSVPDIIYKKGTFNDESFSFTTDKAVNESNDVEYYLFNTELIDHFRTIYDSNTM